MPAASPSPRTDDYDRRIDAMRNAARRAEAEKRPFTAEFADAAAHKLIIQRDRGR
jgi:hypothetical protein